MSKIEEILGRDINSIKELREEIKRLQDSIAGVDPETDEFKKTVEQLTAAQEQLTSVTGRNIQENTAAKDSIVGMEKEYKNLYNTYKKLTEEQRNSGMGKQMAQDLEILSDKINKTKMGVGDFKNNIGRYTGSVVEAFKQMGVSVGGLSSPLQAATKGFSSLNTAMKANPAGMIVAVIMTLINVIKAVTDKIKNNEESQMRWNKAMAAFQPIGDAVKNVIDAIAQAMVWLAEKTANAVRWFRSFTAEGRKINAIYDSLADAQNELTKERREYNKLNKQDEDRIADIKEEVSLMENGAEKRNKLNEAIKLQEAVNQRNVELAQKEYDILKQKSELTANSTADEEALAEAENKILEAQTEGTNKIRALNRMMKSSMSGAGAAIDEYREKAKQLYETLVKDSKDRVTQLQEEYEEQKKLLEKYGYDTTLLTKKYIKNRNDVIFENNQKMTTTARNLYSALITEQDKYIKNATEKERNTILGNRFIKEAEKVNEAIDRIDFMDDVMPLNKADLDKKLKEYDYSFEEWFDFLRNNANAIRELGIDIDFPPEFDEKNMDKSIEQLNMWAETVRLAVKNAANNWRDEFADFQIENLPIENIRGLIERLGADARGWLQSAATLIQADEPFYELIGELDRSAAEYIAKANGFILEGRRKMLTEYLQDADLTKEKRIQIEEELFNILKQQSENRLALVELEAERTQEIWEAVFDGFDNFAGSIQTVTNSITSLIQQEISEGKISEAQAKKKRKQLETLEKVALAANLFQIAGSTASGIMGIWNAYAQEKVVNTQTAAATGPAAAVTLAALNAKSLASAIINTTAMATAGLANMAAATMGTITKLSQFREEGSGGVSTTPNMAMIDSSVYTYSETPQDTPEQDELNNRPIVVLVKDIEDGLNMRKVRVTESSW